jgi:hypothetical protein
MQDCRAAVPGSRHRRTASPGMDTVRTKSRAAERRRRGPGCPRDVPWRQQQTYRIDRDMPLDPLDLLARIIAGRINADPLFPRFSRSGSRSRRLSGWPPGRSPRDIAHTAHRGSSRSSHPNSSGSGSREPCSWAADPSACIATGNRCSAYTSPRLQGRAAAALLRSQAFDAWKTAVPPRPDRTSLLSCSTLASNMTDPLRFNRQSD